MARNEEEPRDLRRQVREIADSLAIAFILAMIIRHYVLEVFKIPTKSMEPTLLGDPWTGDKILVNKFSYDFRDPRTTSSASSVSPASGYASAAATSTSMAG